jgi:FkbM family methyltransferase
MTLVQKIKKIINCLLNPRYINAYIRLVCPLFELKEAIKKTRSIENVIDIGSNKGQFSLLVKIYYPHCSIHSFEPQKNYIKIQKKLINKKISYYNFCLGEKNHTKILNITEKEDSSSLLKPNILNESIYKVTKKVKVNIKTLDSILSKKKLNNSIMKIDVQGYEYQVLKGSSKLLKKIKYIILEITSKNIYQNQLGKKHLLSFLKKKNFRLIKIYNKEKLTKNISQHDYFFENSKLKQ